MHLPLYQPFPQREREREREREPLHSTMGSSELDIYEVFNGEVRELGFEPKTQCL